MGKLTDVHVLRALSHVPGGAAVGGGAPCRVRASREDASRIGFDEEPVFEASHACPEARAVLSDYIRRGGLVYNG